MKIRNILGEYLNPKKKDTDVEPVVKNNSSHSDMEEWLIETALEEFSDIAVFDKAEDLCIMIRRQNQPVPPEEQVTRYYYESVWDRYINRNVIEAERDQVRSKTKLAAVEAALKVQKTYSVFYHSAGGFRKHLYQAVFLQMEGDDNRMLVGFRNMDIVEEALQGMSDHTTPEVPSFLGRQISVVNETEVHLPQILHDLRAKAQSYINAKRLDLSLDSVDVINEDVFCDGRRLSEILGIVLEHAAKDTKPGGSISVRIKQNHQTDTFSSDYMIMIRHEGSDHSIPSDAAALAKLMGGNIASSPSGDNRVATSLSFNFRNAGSPVKHEPIPALRGLRALVVDNDMNTCFSVSKMLTSIGMRADYIGSGEDAVLRTQYAIEQNDEYHAFIMDWMVSDMNGLDTVRRIRRIIGDTKPIILLTAYDWPDIESEARHAGVTAFCSKPLFMSELQDVLTQPYRVVRSKAEEENVDFEGKRILLAEDNELNLELTAELLTEAGFDVEAAENGMIAVDMMRRAESGYYDLVLMDIQMPTMNGYEAAKVIRKLEDETKAKVPIIAMTANASREDEEKVLAAGMNRYLTKPVDIHRLLEEYTELTR